MKRSFAMVLSLVLLFCLLPTPASAAQGPVLPDLKIDNADRQAKPAAKELPQSAYDTADGVFDALEALEDAPETKGLTGAQMTEKVVQTVTASPSCKADSVETNGEVVTWWTNDGIHCMYNPRMEQLEENFNYDNAKDEVVNQPVAAKGKPASKQVYLIGPYYGIDDTFEFPATHIANRAAEYVGDTDGYTLYSGRAATVDRVAEAVSNGAIVIFDSHGGTDYYNNGDQVTYANYSYLCLNNNAGITDRDYASGATYNGDGITFVNGDVIANHMTKPSPGGIVYMTICLGMATDTLCNPLRDMGVDVVFGWSQEVTFGCNWLFGPAFWNTLLQDGATVAQAMDYARETWGYWDRTNAIGDYYGWGPSIRCPTFADALAYPAAFPIVVSAQDAHPGQRYGSFMGADTIQNVQCTYTLDDMKDPTIPTQTSYHQQVVNWVSSDITYTWWKPEGAAQQLTLNLENYKATLMILVNEDGLNLRYTLTGIAPPCMDVYVNVLLPENASTFDLDMSAYCWDRNFYVDDRLYYSQTYSRTDFSAATPLAIPGGENGYLTAEQSTELINTMLLQLFDTWDMHMYQDLGFGLKRLGFTNFEGRGTGPVTPGDMNGDDAVTNDDVIALMWNVLFPEDNPITGNGDLDGDGAVTNADVTLLMWHVLFPEENPL